MQILIFKHALAQFLQLAQPEPAARVAGHTQVASGRHCHGTHLGTVRQAGTLKLLAEESPVEHLHPFQYDCIVILAPECLQCHAVNLGRRITVTQGII